MNNRGSSEISPAQPPFFTHEKKRWKKIFLSRVKYYLYDENGMAQAFNSRQSLDKYNHEMEIYESHNQFDANELKIALNELDAGNIRAYKEHDRDRTGAALLKAGYAQEDIQSMRLSDILKYEAAIFAAQEDIANLQVAYYPALFRRNDIDPVIVLADQKEFENTLTQLAKPLFDQHQSTKKMLKLSQHEIETGEYFTAYFNLRKTLRDQSTAENLKTKGSLISKGQMALEEIEKLRKYPNVSLPELTVSLNVINETIIEPTSNNAFACRKQAKRVGSYAWGTMLAGIMMTLAGATMTLISGVLTVASLASTPVSGPLGIGGAVVSGCVGVMGLGAMVGGATLFAQGYKHTAETKAAKKSLQSLADQAEQLSEAKEEREESTKTLSRTSSICS